MTAVTRDQGGFPRTTDAEHEAWETALDRLELDVIRTERALEAEALLELAAWAAPGGHGPVPDDLRMRAEQILERQRDLIARISERLGTTLRQQAVVAEVGRSSTRPSETSAYIDVTA